MDKNHEKVGHKKSYLHLSIFRSLSEKHVLPLKKKDLMEIINPRADMRDNFNPLTPNDPYRGRTAPLTSKVAFYIFIQQI